MGASVIAGVDAPPILEFTEHIFDFMSLAIEGFVEGCGEQPALAWRDAGRNALGSQGGAILIAVIAFIADHRGGVIWQRWICELCTDMVAHLPFAQT